MADITNQLQKTALNEASKNKERIKELVKELENDQQMDDMPPAWVELKKLIGAAEPEGKKEDGEDNIEDSTEDDADDTVESLVEDNTKDELLDLAKEEEVEVSESSTKSEIAQAILDKRGQK
jgi:hypothetical protein